VRRAVFYSIDREMFPPAVSSASTVIRAARRNQFDTILAVPESTIPRGWMDWAERQVGVRVAEVAFDRLVRIRKTANPHLPVSAVYRYCFEHFAGDYDRLLYLDADTRIVGDVSVLFDLSLDGFSFAAVQDHVPDPAVASPYRASLGLSLDIPYLNSGVLLIDPSRWLAEDTSARVLAFLEDHLDACWHADQSALNAVVRGEFQHLSPVWNMLFPVWFLAQLQSVIEPAVLHYVGGRKPWRPLQWRLVEAREELPYREFFRRSPWSRYMESFFTVRDLRLYWRFRRRRLLRRLRGRPLYAPPDVDERRRYVDFVRQSAFADVTQGLAARTDGMLRAVA
jgi:lipopolysaccharide biosynthesis glycosyltransferase